MQNHTKRGLSEHGCYCKYLFDRRRANASKCAHSGKLSGLGILEERIIQNAESSDYLQMHCHQVHLSQLYIIILCIFCGRLFCSAKLGRTVKGHLYRGELHPVNQSLKKCQAILKREGVILSHKKLINRKGGIASTIILF